MHDLRGSGRERIALRGEAAQQVVELLFEEVQRPQVGAANRLEDMELEGVDALLELLQRHVVYRILRSLCDAFDVPLEEFEQRIDTLELHVFQSIRRANLQALYELKQELHDLLRRLAAQRDAFPTAAAQIIHLPGLTQGRREELSDIRDQLVEIAGELQRHYGDVATLITLFFNASSDRLSRHAYRLTILATFFVIATTVTGFFGQNFKWLTDNIASREAFLLYGVGGLAAPITAFGIFVWIRRRDWL